MRLFSLLAAGHLVSAKTCNNVQWVDSDGNGCKNYKEKGYCTENGEKGKNWGKTWGNFIDYTLNGRDASLCPECGCKGKVEEIICNNAKWKDSDNNGCKENKE